MTNAKENNVKLEPEKKRRESGARKSIPHTRKKQNVNVKEGKKENQKIQTSKIKRNENKPSEQRNDKSRARRKNTKLKEDVRIKKSPLKIIPLGGLLEIGKNITVFEYEDEIIIVDCRLSFPNRRYAWS